MKKRYLIFTLALVLSFTGCGKDNEETSADTTAATETVSSDENTDNSDNSSQDAKETVVGEKYSKEGTFSVSFEEEEPYEYEYSYSVPMITDGSLAAKDINEEIYSFAESSIAIVENVVNNGADMNTFVEPEFIQISYKAFENGDIVSIVVEGDSIYSDWREYKVFNYDKAKQARIDNSELLKAANISEDEFISKARGTFANQVVETMRAFVDSDDGESQEDDMSWKGGMVADLIRDCANTIKTDNINPDMMTYLNEDGELCAIALIYVPAGAGQYYNDILIGDYDIADCEKTLAEYAEKYHYDGFEKGCIGLWDLEGYSVSITHEIEGGDEYTESVYMGFDDTDPSKFLIQYAGDRYSASYSGTIKFVGLDEQGIKFEYEMTEMDNKPIPDDQEALKGTFSLSEYSYYDETMEEMISGSNYIYIDGYDMLDSKGEIIEMEKSFG